MAHGAQKSILQNPLLDGQALVPLIDACVGTVKTLKIPKACPVLTTAQVAVSVDMVDGHGSIRIHLGR